MKTNYELTSCDRLCYKNEEMTLINKNKYRTAIVCIYTNVSSKELAIFVLTAYVFRVNELYKVTF